MSPRRISTLACAAILTASPAHAVTPPVFTANDRVVNLGDSITDGQTYALLLQAALTEAHKPVPTFIGAGIGGDVSAGMLARLDRDVLVHHPTWVMLNCGINDIGTKVKMPAYETSVEAIATRLEKENVKLMILTTTDIRGRRGRHKLNEVNAILHGIAQKHGLIIAEVYDRMQEARLEHPHLWESDGCHLNFEGYRAMTRAILDAMGYGDVPVPTELHPPVLPGIIADWKILNVDEKAPELTEATVAALKPDAQWKDLTLPQTIRQKGWWWDQERSRGIAVGLNDQFGGKRHIVMTEINSPTARSAFINTGGDFQTIWLNGKKLPKENHGWHAGNNRLPVQLQAGDNTVVLEANNTFSVSVTDTNTW